MASPAADRPPPPAAAGRRERRRPVVAARARGASPGCRQPLRPGRRQRIADARLRGAVDAADGARIVAVAGHRRRSRCAGKWRTTSSSAGSSRSGQAQALPELAHSRARRSGGPGAGPLVLLSLPGRRCASARSGRTRTFPAPDALAQRLRLAYASCQRWEHGYFSAYRHMLRGEPGRGAVPGRLHLRVPDRRPSRCGCPAAAGC